jgi:hypothetical protein
VLSAESAQYTCWVVEIFGRLSEKIAAAGSSRQQGFLIHCSEQSYYGGATHFYIHPYFYKNASHYGY